jgi:hypothetical protein
MIVLDLGLAAIFFAVGWILSWSKSAKGSAVVTLLLGLVGGGSGGIVFGSGHLSPKLNSASLDPAAVGWLLMAIGLGTVAGLSVGTLWKQRSQKSGQDVTVGMAQPEVSPENKL